MEKSIDIEVLWSTVNDVDRIRQLDSIALTELSVEWK